MMKFGDFLRNVSRFASVAFISFPQGWQWCQSPKSDPFPISVPELMGELGNRPRDASEGGAKPRPRERFLVQRVLG